LEYKIKRLKFIFDTLTCKKLRFWSSKKNSFIWNTHFCPFIFREICFFDSLSLQKSFDFGILFWDTWHLLTYFATFCKVRE